MEGVRMKDKIYKPKLISNKKSFGFRGVIFELESEKERNAIVLCHWPHCGMDSKTARKLSVWLNNRADDLDARYLKKVSDNVNEKAVK